MRTVMLSLLFFFAYHVSVYAMLCQPSDAEISTTPIIEQTPRRLAKAKEFAKFEGTTDVLIIGDSIAEGWGGTQAKDFSGLSVTNMGLSGERTQELLWRLKEITPHISPTRIVLIIGTNNLRERRYTPCEVFGGINAVSKELRALWPEAHLSIVPLLPMGLDFAFRKSDRKTINDMIAASVEGATLVSIDESAMTCDWALKGCKNYRADKIHPVQSGYALLRRALTW